MSAWSIRETRHSPGHFGMVVVARFWQPHACRMVYYKNEPWLLLHGVSYFGAYIKPETRKWEDVHWTLDMQFISGSQIWRRVQMRPRIVISLSSFQVPGTSWKDLQRVKAALSPCPSPQPD